MQPVVIMCDATERLHVHFPAVFAVKTPGHEMRPSILLYQKTFRHVNATSFRQFIE